MHVLICPVVILKDPTSFLPSFLSFLVAVLFGTWCQRGRRLRGRREDLGGEEEQSYLKGERITSKLCRVENLLPCFTLDLTIGVILIWHHSFDFAISIKPLVLRELKGRGIFTIDILWKAKSFSFGDMFADSSLCSIWDTLYTCPPWPGTLDVLAVGWRNTLVLSNLVFPSLSLQVQMPRNLKVSICILQNVHDGDLLVNTCLQEITMHICIITQFLFFCSDAYSQAACSTSCLSLLCACGCPKP